MGLGGAEFRLPVLIGGILAVSALKMLRHRRVADRISAQAAKSASGTIDP
jgi:hypothetical protein